MWKVETERSFSVDAESAAMLQDFELERILEMHDRGMVAGEITAGYKWYLQFGCLRLSHAQKAEHDEVCRRTAFKDQHGLTLDYDIDRLTSRAISFAQLPRAGRSAWAHAVVPQGELPLPIDP